MSSKKGISMRKRLTYCRFLNNYITKFANYKIHVIERIMLIITRDKDISKSMQVHNNGKKILKLSDINDKVLIELVEYMKTELEKDQL